MHPCKYSLDKTRVEPYAHLTYCLTGVGANVGDQSKLLCLWGRGEIDAPIDRVYNLFLSNDYVLQYNPMCQECRDVGLPI